MSAWLVWLIVAAVLAVGEILTLGLILAPFAGGALVACLISALGGSWPLSLAVCLAASLILFIALRPLARAHRNRPLATRTNTEALIGKKAVVTERIDPRAGTGSIKLNGEIWSARSADGGTAIAIGQDVEVVEIAGATALVRVMES